MLDIEAVSAVAHEVGVPLIVDNTIATPYLLRPLAFGADIVVHSATKYIGGHGTAIGGVIVDGGRFDFAADPDRFPDYNTPGPELPRAGLRARPRRRFALGANLAYILKARVQLLRDLGPAASPFNAFLLAQGLETLSLRLDRHVANAQAVAEFLRGSGRRAVGGLRRPAVQSVASPGRRSTPRRARAPCWPSRSPVASRRASGSWTALELHSLVANIGDVRSLVIHPASTTHSQLTPEEQLVTGVTPGLVRLAVGIEHIDDILADLEAGFTAAKGA